MSPRRIKSALYFICLCSAACMGFGLSGCTQPATNDHGKLAKADDGHGLHTVNNARLRLLMDELKRLDFERMSADLDAGRKPEAVDEAADCAVSLAADARMIPQVYKNLEMNAESRRVFDQLAVKLQEQCLGLRELARNRQFGAMRARLNDIITTCNTCHASFRGPNVALASEPDMPY